MRPGHSRASPARAALWGVEGLTGAGLGPLLPPVSPPKVVSKVRAAGFPLTVSWEQRALSDNHSLPTFFKPLPRTVLVPCPAFSLAFPAPPPPSILPVLLSPPQPPPPPRPAPPAGVCPGRDWTGRLSFQPKRCLCNRSLP